MCAAPPLAFDLRVTLLHLEPAIWRQLRVPHDLRMNRLHDVLQAAFGWGDSHLHPFHLFDAKGRVNRVKT